MLYTPRPYQRAAIDALHANLAACPLLVAPTGSGKSFMGATLVEEYGLPTLWLAQVKPTMARHQVASVQSLVRRAKPPASLIVIDEAHHATASTYAKILDSYPGVPIVGLTATPFRMDGRGLGDLFGTLVIAARPDELCDAGYLHRPRVYAVGSPDLDGVKITAGDYNLAALDKRTNTKRNRTDIVAEWQKHAAGMRTVVFAVNVRHSLAITGAFTYAGITCEHLDGTTHDSQRDAILARLRSGETQIVSNCMVLTEGWDLPALECAIIARPTASLNLHLQMIGRVMRACDGKDGALVLDHAGNHHRHGLVTRHLDYSLSPDKSVGTSEPLGLRRCGECGLFYETNRLACPECEWAPKQPDIPKLTGEAILGEFDDSSYEYRLAIWRRIEQERESLSYQPGWSKHQYKDRFGDWPIVDDDGILIDVLHASQDAKRIMFQRYSDIAKAKGYKPGWASWKFKDTFGHWPRGFVKAVRNKDTIERIKSRFATRR
jgi:hypothetical protein